MKKWACCTGFILLIASAASFPQTAGEATIWYLGHAGWAVKTENHLLIFDYWEAHTPEGSRSLTEGFVNPDEISDQNVYVFVSHAHGDHYDRSILRWRDSIPNITYIFGWEEGSDSDFVCMKQARETRRLGEVEVSVINHAFDNIPEVAYLVAVDSLVIYHSGDHASVGEKPNPTFADNIDYLARLGKRIDVAFLSTFGRRGGGVVNSGDLYTLQTLRPKVMFPMHQGNNEAFYEEFYREIRSKDLETAVHFAKRPGDRFIYRDGLIHSALH